MKTLLTEFPETAHRELVRISALILEAAAPEFIVLFGRYARTPFPGAQGGYELLVVTENEPLLPPQELLRHIDRNYPRDERTERFLFLHCLSLQFISGNLSQSLFLRTVVAEGILLYDSRKFRYFRNRDFKPTQTWKKALENYNFWYGMGRAHLDTARWTLGQEYTRLSAANLHLAVQAFLKAAELVCYGYQNPHADLKARCVLVARFSEELGQLLGFPDHFDRKLFQRLESYRRNAGTSLHFTLHAESYQHVSEKVGQLGGIVDKLCRDWLNRLEEIRHMQGGHAPETISEANATSAPVLCEAAQPETVGRSEAAQPEADAPEKH